MATRTGDGSDKGALVAAVSANALLLLMALFNWFATDAGSVNAWQAFGVIDVLLLLAAAAGIALAVTGLGSASRAPIPVGFAAASLGLLASTLILFKIIEPPALDATMIGQAVDVFGVDGTDVKLGSYLGLIAAAGITWGGWASTTVGTSSSRAERLRGGLDRRRAERSRPPLPDRPTRPPLADRPDPPAERELPVSRTAAQRAADRAERRRRSQSSSD